MAERAAYSRVYWSIIDDPKFETIYDHDDRLATWLRLLLIADQAWPAPAHIPRGARVGVVALLSKAGLIDLLHGGDRYRIHGLDAERNRRRADAERIRGRNPGTQSEHASPARNAGAQVRAVDETSQDEGRQDKTSSAVERALEPRSTRGGPPVKFADAMAAAGYRKP